MNNPHIPLPVIFNPHAGKRRALRRLQQRLGTDTFNLDLRETLHPGHAEELARKVVDEGHGVVAAAGGDGTVHEVANGLLNSGRDDVSLALIPIGSANDYYESLRLDAVPAEQTNRLVDVGQVRTPHGKRRYFVCCLGLGLNGAVTRESRRIRGLQGIALYGLATLRALWYHYDSPEMVLTFDDQAPVRQRTLMLSVLVGRREGGFVMAPNARMDDGQFDYVHAGALSRWRILQLLPRLALWGAPSSYPGVSFGRCQKLAVQSTAALTVHIDGEFFCLPEDNIDGLEIDLIAKRLRVVTDLAVLSRTMVKE